VVLLVAAAATGRFGPAGEVDGDQSRRRRPVAVVPDVHRRDQRGAETGFGVHGAAHWTTEEVGTKLQPLRVSRADAGGPDGAVGRRAEPGGDLVAPTLDAGEAFERRPVAFGRRAGTRVAEAGEVAVDGGASESSRANRSSAAPGAGSAPRTCCAMPSPPALPAPPGRKVPPG
jgi:hypothetical protein